MEIKKVRVDKLECRCPVFFRIMWWTMLVWLVASVLNYLMDWVPVYVSDIFGCSIIFIFGICLFFSFVNGLLNRVIEDKGLATYTGRIRRLGNEIIAAIITILLLFDFGNDSSFVNLIVVIIASFFLYDIWKFADIK